MSKKWVLIIVIPFLILISLIILFFYKKSHSILGASTSKPNVTLVFVGDSMTQYLGNFDELRLDLKKYYPNTTFQLLNYGFGSTNILSVPDRLEKLTNDQGREYKPINDIPFDLIFIESMGYNPLSSLPLDQGLKKQTDTLDQIIKIITQKHKKSQIIFISTIAPNKDYFGGGVLNLLPDQKEKWVQERIAYIKNHMNYAKAHNIPLINIYDQSLDKNGQGNIDYINSNDFIHPSPTGIIFISQTIADFIGKNKLF